MTDQYTLAVVGAGLVGVAAARHAASAGVSTVVVGSPEPADPAAHDGPFASHYDSGRITRHLDPSPIWAELAARSIARYPTIESASGIDFHRPVGVLWADPSDRGLDDLADAADRYDVALEPVGLSDRTAAHWRFTGEVTVGLERAPAGFIDPRRMVAAQLAAARLAGATVLEDVVTSIEVEGGVEIVLRSGKTVSARDAVVAAGAYTPLLVERMIDLPITPIAVAVLEAEVSDTTAAALRDMPAMIHRTRGDDTVDVYAVPPTRYPDGRRYLKLGVETLPEAPLAGEAEMRWWMTGDAAEWRTHLEEVLDRLLPDVAFVGTTVKPCMYARTRTGYPIVDHVAEGVVVAAGGNGRAAKSADAIGELAAGLALNRAWSDSLPRVAFAAPR